MSIDDDILRKCKSGDRRAQQTLYEVCFPFFMKVCRLYSLDDQEAMSFLNAGFFKILKGLKKKKTHIPYFQWARRVLVNCIIDEYRKNKTYKKSETQVECYLQVENQNSYFDSNLADLIFEAEDIVEMIRKLPETTSKVFILFAVDEFDYREIAEKLKIKEVTARWHVSKARKELIKMMDMEPSFKKKQIHESIR